MVSPVAEALAGARANPFRPDLFAGEVAIVTGGATGIGLATAEELLQLGASVAICGRTEARVLATAEALAQRYPGRVLGRAADTREPTQIEALIAATVETLGKPTLLVNNAGGQFPSPAAAISARGFEAVVRNNLLGTFNVTRETAVRVFIPERRGVIVNVIANVARGFPGMAHTGAARAGVDNLTKTLAIEWASFGVRVNAVAPGIIESDAIKQYPAELIDAGRRQTPLKRLGSVEECAHAIVYLCSPAAAFITGATLNIDGGASLWGDTWSIPDEGLS